MGRLSKHQDPIAVVLSSVVGILGALGLIERAGLTADQVAQIVGFAVAIGASIRTVFERRRLAELEDLRATVQTHERRAAGEVDDTVDSDTTDRIDPEEA
jgi:hypothetical protein